MRRWLVALLCLVPLAAPAKEAVPLGDDPVVERRVTKLSAELRCLVCQNQSLADSNADLAIDLRNEVRALVKAGKSDAQIKDWLTQRYGDFVLYNPPVKATTWLLWFGPFVLLVAAFGGLFLYIARRRAHTRPTELSRAEHARAQTLLQDADQRPAEPS
jgi:cytochrome c-type biogenesis protein CcmH